MADDYTPTTEEVAHRWITQPHEPRHEGQMKRKAEFYRWLAAHDAGKDAVIAAQAAAIEAAKNAGVYEFRLKAQERRTDPYYVGSSQPVKDITVVAATEENAKQKAREVLGAPRPGRYWRFLLVSSAPSVSLDAVKAEAWGEGYTTAFHDKRRIEFGATTPSPNPYKGVQS